MVRTVPPRLARPLLGLLGTVLATAALLLLTTGASAAVSAPDSEGFYVWKDDVHSPVYNWQSIAGDPAAVELNLANHGESAAIDISAIGFRFFAQDATDMWVNNNGFVSFSSQGAGHQQSAVHPNTAAPNHLVSGCWRNLYPDDTDQNPGSLSYLVDTATNTTIVEWNGYDDWGDATGINFVQLTFQIRLNGDDDTIDVVINDCPGNPDGEELASVGIEDDDGSTGLNWQSTAGAMAAEVIRFEPKPLPKAVNDTDLKLDEDDGAQTVDVLANDLDDDTLTIKSVTFDPNLGTATITSDDKIRYTPAADAHGSDTVNYTVEDPWKRTSTANFNVTIKPSNDPPTATFGDDVTLDEDDMGVTQITDWLSGLAVGPATALDERDGVDPGQTGKQSLTVTFEHVSGDESIFTTAPSLTSDSGLPWHEAGKGTLSWALKADAHGTVAYDVTVSDDNGTSGDDTDDASVGPHRLTFTIQGINDEPTWTLGSGYRLYDDDDDVVMDGPYRAIKPIIGTEDPTFQPSYPAFFTNVWPHTVNGTDEDGHGVRFEITVDDATAFLELPKLTRRPDTRDWTLSYETETDWHGSVDLGFTLIDDNGTADATDDLVLGPREATLVIQPSNDPPTAVADTLRYLAGSGAVTIDVLANDHGAPDEGESMRIHLDTATQTWAFTQAVPGTFDDGQWVPGSGTVGVVSLVGGLPTFTYDGPSTLARFEYTIDDWADPAARIAPQAQLATGVVTLTILNVTDLGRADGYMTGEDTPLRVDALTGVLANDARPTGGSLKAHLLTSTQNGALSLLDDGSFEYTPDPDFSGKDSFTYEISTEGGRRGGPVPVSISITGSNDAPTTAGDDYRVLPGGASRILATQGVLQNDRDRDGELLRAYVEYQPRHGAVVLDEDGAFVYQPDEGFTGLDIWGYYARDSTTTSLVTEVRMLVAGNQAPQAAFDVHREKWVVGRALSFEDASIDADGEIRRWHWDFGNGATSSIADPAITFRQPGEYDVRLTVTDDQGATASVSKSILILLDWSPDMGGAHRELAVADPGPDRVVLQSTRVLLRGDLLAPLQGTGIGFEWRQVDGPTVRLTDDRASMTSFMAPAVAPKQTIRLSFELVVFDGYAKTDPAEVTLFVQDTLSDPVADAGNDLDLVSGQAFQLKGSALGFDPAANVTFQWVQMNGPPMHIAHTGPSIALRAPLVEAPTTFRFALQATDGRTDARADEVNITVNPLVRPGGFLYRTGVDLNAHVVAFTPVLNGVEIERLHWDFGDGTNSTEEKPRHGYAGSGDYNVTLTVVDMEGQTSTFSRSVLVVATELDAQSTASRDSPAVALVALFGAIAFLAVLRRK